MKSLLIILLLLSVILSSSCSNATNDEVGGTKAGVLVAADSMRIIEDELNDLYFTIKLLTTENSDSGKYELSTAWGYNQGSTFIRLPKGLEHITPEIRKDSAYTYIIGFRAEGDSSFRDYFRVASRNGNIEMRYIKAYYFQ